LLSYCRPRSLQSHMFYAIKNQACSSIVEKGKSVSLVNTKPILLITRVYAHSNPHSTIRTYGKVRISIDVILDDTIDFYAETVSPSDSDFIRRIDEQKRIVCAGICASHSTISPTYSSAYAYQSAGIYQKLFQSTSTTRRSLRQCTRPPPCQSTSYASRITGGPSTAQQVLLPTIPAQPAQEPPAALSPTTPLPLPGEETPSDTLIQRKPATYHRLPTVHPSTNIDIEEITIKKSTMSNEF
jgi:hypothetical protein